MYSVADYASMIADRTRVDAYQEALRRTARPGCVVLDIGTGAGIFALMACRFGARKVYALEPQDMIQVAREIAVANGCAERIEFIQDVSTAVTLPELADVIVSDLRGTVPFFGQHLGAIMDARRRFLAPGGSLIPRRDALWAAVVEAPELYQSMVGSWEDTTYGLDLRAARRLAANRCCKTLADPDQLLVEPECWATLDYMSVKSANAGAELTWPVLRRGTAHGLVVWFDAMLADDVHFSNAPGRPPLIYGNVFFPLAEPTQVTPGDTISVSLQASLLGHDYIWRWNTRVMSGDNSAQVKAAFRQSTFFGAPLSTARLRKWADGYVSTLNEDGRIDRLILGLMDGKRTSGEIAQQVSDQFRARFAQWETALTRVGELSERYGGGCKT